MGGGGGGGGGYGWRAGLEHVTDNKIKDYQNFLSRVPLQCFNLKPNNDGLVEVNIEDIKNYSQIFVVACDYDSVVQR